MKKQTRSEAIKTIRENAGDTRWRVKDEPDGGVRLTLEERGKVHGDYTKDATTAMDILDVFEATAFDNLTAVQRHSLTMIAFKIARILTGDPNHKDHWHDIAGYATLAEDRCE